MRVHKTIGLLAILMGVAYTSLSASAGVITAVLHGQGNGIVSSGSTINLDLSASYFDFSAPQFTTNPGIIDQYLFDFGDGTANTGWMTTPFASHVYTGIAGQLFAASGAARWSGAPAEVAVDNLIIKITSQGQSGVPNGGVPVAVFGGPFIYNVNQPTLLDGTSSYDPDGDPILTYEWDFHDHASFLAEATGSQVLLTFAQPGIHIVGLRVSDGQFYSAPVYAEFGTLGDFGLPVDWPYNTAFAPMNSATVPEPGTFAIMAMGLALLGFPARRRKQKGA